MLVIKKNIEDRAYSHKDWFKEMDTIVGEHFDTTTAFDNSVSIGTKIVFDDETTPLPNGVSIPAGSKITMATLSGKTLVILGKTINGKVTIINSGIRSLLNFGQD